MVNTNKGTRFQVLSMLRNSAGALSGEYIAQKAGVSRVAVWKAVHSLQESGYDIKTEEGGYKLLQDKSDSLYPWEFGEQEALFHHWIVTDTTMKRAKELACKGAPHGSIITADTQTEGKGTGTRTWLSPEGNLFFTIIIRQNLPLAKYQKLKTCAQLALCDAIYSETGITVIPRWPNDIWAENNGKTGKIAGILTELSGSGDTAEWITLGIGVNIAQAPDIPAAASLYRQGITIQRRYLLTAFIKNFTAVQMKTEQDIAKEWNRLCADCGKKAEFIYAGTEEKTRGIFNGIDENGFACFSSETGTHLFLPGSGSFIKEYDWLHRA